MIALAIIAAVLLIGYGAFLYHCIRNAAHEEVPNVVQLRFHPKRGQIVDLEA